MLIPVAFVRRKHIWRMTPLAHLKHSNEKQRVYPKYAGRDRETKQLCCTPCSIAEIICIRECPQLTVNSRCALDCKVREDPISWREWSCIAQKTIYQTRNTNLPPRHVEVIEPKIVVSLQPGNVQPIINNYSYAAELKQTYRFHGSPIFRPNKSQKGERGERAQIPNQQTIKSHCINSLKKTLSFEINTYRKNKSMTQDKALVERGLTACHQSRFL